MATVSEYKGKIPCKTRGWATLPCELVQYIATLSIISVNTQQEPGSINTYSWQARLVYYALRDAVEMDRLMRVCLGWKLALDLHLFWQHAVSTIDPFDTLAQYAVIRPSHQASNNSSSNAASVKSMPMPSVIHFHNILRCSCVPCRIQHPHTSHGLTASKHMYYFGPNIGMGGICANHSDPLSFCHLCFRDPGVCTNSDYESFPGVASVCRHCRRCVRNWGELIFDDESKRMIEGYVSYGDGTARRTAEFCLDRNWLRQHTRITEMLPLVRANAEAYRLERERPLYDSDDEILDESEEEDEDEEFERIDDSARQMALLDWSHGRVLSGLWVLPTDHWLEPWHPITLARSRPFDSASPPSITNMEPPPSLALSEQANIFFMQEVKAVLLPPFRNMLRKLIMQGGGPKDAQRMTLREIGEMLKEEGTWWEGWDWPRHPRASSDDGSDDSAPSTSSSESPVLSTSTLQTTPSPPPTTKSKDDDSSEYESPVPRHGSRQTFIPIGPVLDPPRQLRHVPWIPDDLEALPENSRKAIMRVWRDACDPLYACECNICERARAPVSPQASQNTITLVPSQQVETVALAHVEEDVDGEADLEYEEYSSEAESSLEEYLGDITRVGRKRSLTEADVEDAVEDDDRPRTPPKRRRAVSPESVELSVGNGKGAQTPSRKRSSEEVEALEVLDGKRAKRGVDVA